MTTLPTVVVSSVIRSAHQGESHGGVYLVDLDSGSARQALDWDDPTINFEGRGADRGLRGIAFHDDELYLAASNEVFVFDPSFQRLRSIRNPYLAHCHEIDIADDRLHLTSTGFDAVLTYDLSDRRFVAGHHLRWSRSGRWRKRRLRRWGHRPLPEVFAFDPEAEDGPPPGDTCHINNVTVMDGALLASGTGVGHLLRLGGTRLRSAARIPYGTHNARPFRGGVLVNDTAEDAVVWQDPRGKAVRRYPLPRYAPSSLTHTDLPGDHARQAFGRGLTVVGDVLIVGSSPATITALDLWTGEVLASVNLTRDVRNATHGLEIWPFAGQLPEAPSAS